MLVTPHNVLLSLNTLIAATQEVAKLSAVKGKLELLCKELQKQNKAVIVSDFQAVMQHAVNDAMDC